MNETVIPALMAGGSRRRAWRLPALLLVAGIVCGQSPAPSPSPNPDALAEQEPITPIPLPPLADPLKLALGAKLFDDPLLSRDGTHSCSSCHEIGTNGASNHKTDSTSCGVKFSFNTNTVFNAALSFRLNWEGNIRTLEGQAASSINDSAGMGGNIDTVVQAIQGEKGMKEEFEKAYGHGPDRNSLLDAIATYERSLLTPDSRFDLWLEGKTTLTAEEMAGYQAFKSYGCVSCHQGVNVGGNLFERNGIFHKLTTDQSRIMRVPSLRNVAVTAPYFHDGSATTLDQAVREMAHAQLNRSLSDEDVRAIVAFLNSLTGVYNGRTLTAPP
jgi:cytochrome c peroxidase